MIRGSSTPPPLRLRLRLQGDPEPLDPGGHVAVEVDPGQPDRE